MSQQLNRCQGHVWAGPTGSLRGCPAALVSLLVCVHPSPRPAPPRRIKTKQLLQPRDQKKIEETWNLVPLAARRAPAGPALGNKREAGGHGQASFLLWKNPPSPPRQDGFSSFSSNTGAQASQKHPSRVGTATSRITRHGKMVSPQFSHNTKSQISVFYNLSIGSFLSFLLRHQLYTELKFVSFIFLLMFKIALYNFVK